LTIIIFTDNPTVKETQLVLGELKERKIRHRFMAPWDLALPEFPKLDADMVYVPSNMFNRGSTFELIHRLLILREFERQVGTVVNPVDSMLIYSKGHLTVQLSNLGILHPTTLVTENIDKAHEFASGLLDAGKTVVLKPICRGRGIGVVRLDRIRSRSDLLQYLMWYNRSFGQGVFYLVVDGEVVGREKRSNPQDFRYNVSAGGLAEPFDDPVYDELSIKVAEAVGLRITGIDVLPTSESGPYILEANCFPGYTALIEATGIPIHARIVDYFQSLMAR
jgi:glutathione synthase/RimK-type ligase-like ATP-grasp enzyme